LELLVIAATAEAIPFSQASSGSQTLDQVLAAGNTSTRSMGVGTLTIGSAASIDAGNGSIITSGFLRAGTFDNTNNTFTVDAGGYVTASGAQMNGDVDLYSDLNFPGAGNINGFRALSNGAFTVDAGGDVTASGEFAIGSATTPYAQFQIANSQTGGFPGGMDIVCGVGNPDGGDDGQNTQLQIFRSAVTSGYVVIDSYIAGVGGTDLILQYANHGRVLIAGRMIIDPGGTDADDGASLLQIAGVASAVGYRTSGGLPTADPMDGTFTLWADPTSHIVFQGT
jgi:hypothetical protein